jgi:hypothetical protein
MGIVTVWDLTVAMVMMKEAALEQTAMSWSTWTIRLTRDTKSLARIS